QFPKDTAPFRSGLAVRLFGDDQPRELCPSSGRGNPRPPQGELDLTFVCVEWLGLPLFNSALPAREVRVGDELQLLRPDAGDDFGGKVAGRSDQGRQGDVQTTFRGVETMSGSPVASPAGVVGVFLGADDSTSGGRLLSMQSVKAKALEKAAVPWQLIE